ncbi:MAG TPA: copper resistance CopC family protein [Actinomycetota bacterium]|nr:copper resistance CopC family protein [Actinomycetota bacterium]
MLRRIVILAVLLVSTAAPAFGHGEEITTDPEDGARLDAPPSEVGVALTEPPARGSTIRVLDGCGDDVVGRVSIAGPEMVARIRGGQPGRWRVRWAAISAVDGHPTQGRFSFRVAGESDCAAEPEPDPATSTPSSPEEPAEGDGEEDGSSGVPVGVAAAVALGIVALAIVARRSGSG